MKRGLHSVQLAAPGGATSPSSWWEVVGAGELNLSHVTLVAVFSVPLVVALTGMLMAGLDRKLYFRLTAEDGVVEDLQVIFLTIAFLLSLRLVQKLREAGHPGFALFYACMSAGILFVVGEELDWGQRMIGWATPAALNAVNAEHATNLHEIPGANELFKGIKLFIGACGTVLPLMALRANQQARLRGTLLLLAPPAILVPYFLVVLIWKTYRLLWNASNAEESILLRYSEFMELTLALALLLLMALQLKRVKSAFKTNRVLSRAEAAQLDLSARIKLEMTLTDAEAETIQPKTIAPTAVYATYRNRSPWRRELFDFLEPLEGRTILDLGCGFNPTPVYLALAGAKRVYACDVSPRAVAYVRKAAQEAGVADRVFAFVAAAEQLPLPDSSIDVVHGESTLHHLELKRAGQELARVMKRVSKAAFKDPQGHNKLLEFARDYLPYKWKKAAKGTDRPLRFAEVEEFGRNFDRCQYRGFCFFAMPARLVFGRGKSKARNLMYRLDNWLLDVLPFLRRYGRFVVTCVERKDEGHG